MSWKNVRDHYRIGHQVQINDGRICIGSPYIYDLIRVSLDGAVSWGNLGPSNNPDLARYYAEMTADPVKLRELVTTPDTFTASIPVFTYDGGEIIEKQCETLGWPNVTHDGLMMYANTFSADKATVVAWAKRNADLGIESARRRIEEAETDLLQARTQLALEEADRAELEADYPAASNTEFDAHRPTEAHMIEGTPDP
jgi:hypothetical protein